MTDDEKLSAELQGFEDELRSLKPARADVVCDVRLPRTRRKRKALIAAGSVMAAIAASILIVWVALRSPVVEDVIEPVGPSPGTQIVEIQPQKTREIAVPGRTPDERFVAAVPGSGGFLNVRQQTARMLEEMRLDEPSVAAPARKPDYPVAVITVNADSRPLSPEAKQAIRQRLRGDVGWNASSFH